MKKIIILTLLLIFMTACINQEKEKIIKQRSEGIVEEGDILTKITRSVKEKKTDKVLEDYGGVEEEIFFDENGNILNPYTISGRDIECKYNEKNLVSNIKYGKNYSINEKLDSYKFEENLEYYSDNLLKKRTVYENGKHAIDYDYFYKIYSNGKVKEKKEVMKHYLKIDDINDYRYTFKNTPKNSVFKYDIDGDITYLIMDNPFVSDTRTKYSDHCFFNIYKFDYDEKKRLKKVTFFYTVSDDLKKEYNLKENRVIERESFFSWSGDWVKNYPKNIYPDYLDLRFDRLLRSNCVLPIRNFSENLTVKEINYTSPYDEERLSFEKSVTSEEKFRFNKNGYYKGGYRGKKLFDNFGNYILNLSSSVNLNKNIKLVQENNKSKYKIQNDSSIQTIDITYKGSKINKINKTYIDYENQSQEDYFYFKGKKRINISRDIIWYILNEEYIKKDRF